MEDQLYVDMMTTTGLLRAKASLSINDAGKIALLAVNPIDPDEYIEVEIVQEPDGTLSTDGKAQTKHSRAQIIARDRGRNR